MRQYMDRVLRKRLEYSLWNPLLDIWNSKNLTWTRPRIIYDAQMTILGTF